jgi:hypothetical protein
MSEYRIVYNEQTERYRIEQRGWAGWTFVLDEAGAEYATFDSFEAARRFACVQQRRQKTHRRRWRIVDLCGTPFSGD